MQLRRLDRPDDPLLVQELLLTTADYTERITGQQPGPSDGADLLIMRPPGTQPDDKHVLGLFDDEELVGVLDLIRGYPDVSRSFLGLLLIHGRRRGEGLARQIHEAGLDLIRSWPEVTAIRLGVVQTNAEANLFWEVLGYRPTGVEKPWQEGSVTSTTRLFEQTLLR